MAISRAERLRLANLRRQQKRAKITYEDPAEPIKRKISHLTTGMQRVGMLAASGLVGVGVRGLATATKMVDTLTYPGMAAAKFGIRQLAKERKARIAERKPQPRFEQHAGIIDLQKSSLVHYLFYHVQEQVIQTRLNGVNYYYTGVPVGVIDAWKEGGTCQTNDPTVLRRWWAGKTHSLGAFFNQQIKGHYPYHRGVFRP